MFRSVLRCSVVYLEIANEFRELVPGVPEAVEVGTSEDKNPSWVRDRDK